MAKKNTKVLMMLIPEEKPETGTKYMFEKTRNLQGKKFRVRKYDPVLMKHVWFIEKKLPSSKAR